jgi:hypothetical protein
VPQLTVRGMKTKQNKAIDTSDRALLDLLKRLKEACDHDEIPKLSDQLERMIFHKQLENA